ncbi:acetoin dehydrogenase dihydrolipoyllysine-residue acetyltransferase subunit [Methylobacterium sp. ID0610]|uniref:acetoin dehydrogenase dihydrolipoyllysine-residue acetyltransferase subunit n=1 Tax=Methylobacterium carpenticola TaxID=3344827 RepID=UPI00367A9AD6
MAMEVILPKVDMDMATGRISRWLAREGDPVRKGEVLFEIETDKAAMEVEAPATGTLRRVSGAEGIDIPVGQAVAWIYADGEAETVAAAAAAGREADPAEGEGAAVASANGSKPVPAEFTPEPAAGHAPVRATPLARRLARMNGIALPSLAGSGPRGRIQRRDVDRHLAAARPESAPARHVAAAHAPAPAAEAPSARPVEAKSRRAPTVAQPSPDLTGRAPYEPAGTQSPLPGLGAGIPLHAVWLRQGSGIPVVLLHGFGADLAGWRPMLTAFDRAVPILGLDLPGHGGSVDVPALGFDDLVTAAETALVALGVSCAHLVGHSLGGAVATAIAAGGTIEARSLFLLAPAGLGPEINTAFIDGFAAATDVRAVRAWMGELVADPAVLTDSLVGAAARARTDGRLTAAQERLARSLFAPGTQLFSTRALFPQFAMPVKVVVGSEDRIVPARQALGLPGSVALHVFPQVGHMPQLERKAEVARLLAELARA